MPCDHCIDADTVFGERTARGELKRFVRRGPRRLTGLLIDRIKADLEGPFTLLDIGSGVGAIPHALSSRLSAGTIVDASRAYLTLSAAHAESMGYSDRMRYLEGDVVELSDGLTRHDAVTLDRVVCCYPDMGALIDRSTHLCGRVFALVFPRVSPLTRLGIPLLNLLMRLRKSSFRVYLHPTQDVLQRVRGNGFRSAFAGRSPLWQVHVFHRSETAVEPDS